MTILSYIQELEIPIFLFIDGPDLEGKLEFVGGKSGRKSYHIGLPIDAVIKLKYKRIQSGQYASPLDPYDIELSFDNTYLNSGRYGRSGEIHIGGEYIKGMVIQLTN